MLLLMLNMLHTSDAAHATNNIILLAWSTMMVNASITLTVIRLGTTLLLCFFAVHVSKGSAS